ncbi:tetratricopeptide repeat protein [Candidatus Sumerlaeota bacterium]|nr:tetratricopeptide repeat protein [Candidatus Sumerlaeota bacterium]
MKKRIAVLIFIAALVLVFYFPSLKADFIWDDDDYVLKNENLKTWNGLIKIWLHPGSTYQYYPMVHTSFWLEYHIWKYNAFGYHLVNILLHGMNAVMIFLILRKLGISWAFLAALVFGLHPAHVESAAWITERKNVLSGFFYLLSLYSYFHFMEGAKGNSALDIKSPKAPVMKSSRRFFIYYALSFILFAFALFSKTVTSTLPFAILLVLWWKRGKIRMRDVVLLIPFIILGGILGMVTARMEKIQIGATGTPWDWTFFERCLIAGKAISFYAGKLLVPHPLIFIYPKWRIDAGNHMQYLYPASVLIVIGALFTLRNKIGRGPITALLYFIMTLFPALGFFNVYPMLYSFVADHFQYLASIGMISLYTGMISFTLNKYSSRKKMTQTIAAGILILSLGALSWKQQGMYRNLETLWRKTIALNSEAWLAHNNLGTLLLDQEKVDEAILHFNETIRINPGFDIAYYNLGYSHLKKGDYEKAIEYYKKAIELNPKYVNAYINLGMVYDDLGEHEQAIENYLKARNLKPESDAVYNCLGYAYSSIGNLDEAIIHYKKCLELNPEHLEANYKLGRAFYEKGDPNNAIHYYEKAIEIDPENAYYYIDIADAFLKKGSGNKAKEALYRGVDLFPEDFWLKNKLAWTLSTDKSDEMRNAEEAIELAEAARRLSEKKEPTILDTLAAAYAEGGRFEEAAQTAEDALKLARELKQEALAKDIEARLALFRNGKAFRE